jgi:ribosomal protein S18 acetylase RimI-like enzyme
MSVRDAEAPDVTRMAELAEAKRQHYRDHATPFQRPALNGREAHEAFLPKLLEWEGFTVLVHDSADGVDGFVVARFGSAPPPYGDGSLFHIDDFALADAASWPTVGRALLGEVMRRAEVAGIETAIVVSGPPSIDKPKAAFLRACGLRVDAEWRVKSLTPTSDELPASEGFDVAVGPAPPVYDPGGLTALALRIDEPEAVVRFEEFAAASKAVVAIVPVRTSNEKLRTELDRRDFSVASEWYVGPVPRPADAD